MSSVLIEEFEFCVLNNRHEFKGVQKTQGLPKCPEATRRSVMGVQCPHRGVSECRTLSISCVLSHRYGFKGVLLKGSGRLRDTVGVRKQLARVRWVSSVHIEESLSAVCQSVRRGRRRGEAVSATAAAVFFLVTLTLVSEKVNSEDLS